MLNYTEHVEQLRSFGCEADFERVDRDRRNSIERLAVSLSGKVAVEEIRHRQASFVALRELLGLLTHQREIEALSPIKEYPIEPRITRTERLLCLIRSGTSEEYASACTVDIPKLMEMVDQVRRTCERIGIIRELYERARVVHDDGNNPEYT